MSNMMLLFLHLDPLLLMSMLGARIYRLLRDTARYLAMGPMPAVFKVLLRRVADRIEY